ncbi:hypothetical protein FOE59_15320, partial [Listeria monocytogenes]|nr:hypothetical protein [Listeria monocytogenes]
KKQVETIESTAKGLSDARVAANNAIKAAGDLSEDEKNNFLAQVTSAIDPTAVKVVQDAAAKQNTINQTARELKEAKAATITEVNGFSEISEAEKNSFALEVNNASVISDVTTAKAKAKALSDARVAANNAIKAAGDLSEDEKNNFLAQVTSAIDPTAVKVVQDAAYNTNKEHETVRLLAESKVATNTIIDDLLELSDTEKADFKEKIANSTL